MLNLRHILCPTDYSEISYEAMRIACHLAARFNAQLDVLHVANPVDNAINAASGSAKPQRPLPLTPEKAATEPPAPSLEEASLAEQVIPRSLTRIGKPAEEIVLIAVEEACDLIIMGTHGHTGWRHLVLGSVAEAVVNAAPCPVLTVRQARDAETAFCVEAPRKILCSTDFSAASEVGLRMALEMASEFNAELILVHALEPFTGYSGLVLDPAEVKAFAVVEAKEKLTALLQKSAVGEVHSRVLAVWGEAPEAIVNTAREENADMIVIATHGLTGWRHLLLGSVAETVVRSADCAVLTVPVKRPDALA